MKESKEVPRDVKILIDAKEQEKIWWYVDKCDKEISGLGKVIKQSDGSLFVNKIYLLKQTVSGTETELDDDAIAELMFEAKDDPGNLMFWWHSHVDMDVFWSGTDYEAIAKLGKGGMIVSTVYNKKRELRTSLFVDGDDYRPPMFMDKLTLYKTKLLTEDEEKGLEEEFDAKVDELKYGGYNTYTGSYLGSAWDDYDDGGYFSKGKGASSKPPAIDRRTYIDFGGDPIGPKVYCDKPSHLFDEMDNWELELWTIAYVCHKYTYNWRNIVQVFGSSLLDFMGEHQHQLTIAVDKAENRAGVDLVDDAMEMVDEKYLNENGVDYKAL